MTQRPLGAHRGPRKLVLSLDVGTTYSGISYCILDPGQVPTVSTVTRFPASEAISGSTKIPTAIYYDRLGHVRAVGAETKQEGIYEQVEDEGWTLAEWFKLHLSPRYNKATPSSNLPPLPAGKSAEEILSDFLKYLSTCAEVYIQDTHPNGMELWNSIKNDIEYVLSHPNGWEGLEQTYIRRAAIRAGLVPDTAQGHTRITFVTEGEANLHFAIAHGLPEKAQQSDDGILLIDAGGGTLDFSAYSKLDHPFRQGYEETVAPQCHFSGSVFVTIAARHVLEELLQDSDFLADLDNMVRVFDRTTKLRFRSKEEPQYIKFGSSRDNDVAHDIRFGQLKISGERVATMFQPSIDRIIQTVQDMCRHSHRPFTHVVMTGGFSASEYLFTAVSTALRSQGFTVIRPSNHVSKAVADGSLLFYLHHHVDARVSKLTFGTRGSINYDARNEEHRKRATKTFTSISGIRRIDDVFWVLLAANSQVPDGHEVRRNHYWEFNAISDLAYARSFMYCSKETIEDAAWMDARPERFLQLCTIEVDLSHLAGTSAVESRRRSSGSVYFKIAYDIVLLFGSTELEARLAWKENGVEKRSMANILYNDEVPALSTEPITPGPPQHVMELQEGAHPSRFILESQNSKQPNQQEALDMRTEISSTRSPLLGSIPETEATEEAPFRPSSSHRKGKAVDRREPARLVPDTQRLQQDRRYEEPASRTYANSDTEPQNAAITQLDRRMSHTTISGGRENSNKPLPALPSNEASVSSLPQLGGLGWTHQRSVSAPQNGPNNQYRRQPQYKDRYYTPEELATYDSSGEGAGGRRLQRRRRKVSCVIQ